MSSMSSGIPYEASIAGFEQESGTGSFRESFYRDVRG
jgi:hypothetical protein